MLLKISIFFYTQQNEKQQIKLLNFIQYNLKIYMLDSKFQIMNIVIFVFCFLKITLAIPSKTIIMQEDPQYVKTLTNRPQEILLPFHRMFQYDIGSHIPTTYLQDLKFQPTSLALKNVGNAIFLPKQNLTVLQNLRTPLTLNYHTCIIIEEYVFLYLFPNQIVILQQKQNTTEFVRSYNINEIGKQKYQQLDFFQYNTTTIVGHISGTNQILFLNKDSYQKYEISMSEDIVLKIEHIVALSNKEFLTAQYKRGLGYYRINEQASKIQNVKQYGSKQLLKEQTQINIFDINLIRYQQSKIILLLDNIGGIISVKFGQNGIISDSKRLVHHSNCMAMDWQTSRQAVLVCMQQSNSYLLQIYASDAFGPFLKRQPIYHRCLLRDIQTTLNYSLVFSEDSIDIFWNSRSNHLRQPMFSETQLDLNGIQTFRIHSKGQKMFLYTVQAGVFHKYEVVQNPPHLFLQASHDYYRDFNITYYGACLDLQPALKEKYLKKIHKSVVDPDSTCKVNQLMQIQVLNQFATSKQQFSISAGFIIILTMVLIIIIWICIKKYSLLQKQARRILAREKHKKPISKFTI